MIGGRVLDGSMLVAFARETSVYAAAVVWSAVEEDVVLLAPATAVATAWTVLGTRAQPVLDVLLGLPLLVVDDLTRPRAREVGEQARGRIEQIDVAHAAACARERDWAVVTGEPLRYAELGVDVEPLP